MGQIFLEYGPYLWDGLLQILAMAHTMVTSGTLPCASKQRPWFSVINEPEVQGEA